jgi:hypothetical protein
MDQLRRSRDVATCMQRDVLTDCGFQRRWAGRGREVGGEMKLLVWMQIMH